MVQTKDRVKKVGINRFEFSGKVTKKDFKFSGKGNMWGMVKLEVPGKEEKFKSFFTVKAFGEIAEKAEQEIKEGDNYSFFGYIQNGSYEKDGIKKYTTDFVAIGYEVAVEGEKSTSNFVPSGAEKDDVPF